MANLGPPYLRALRRCDRHHRGFQPDRAGASGFQLAEDAGFQTQTPAAVGALEVVLSLDGATDRYSRTSEAIGDLSLVLSLDAETFGPRVVFTGGGAATLPNRYEVVGELELVLTLDGRARFTDVIEREDEEPLLII